MAENQSLKIACPSCGQHIEFPADGIGQTIPCPTCEKPVFLTPANPSTQQRWVIVDTETDGLTYPIHVVEIAAQLMKGSEPCGSPFQVYLNHDVPIPSAAFAVHGYSQEFLRENGRPPVEAHEAFRQYAGEFPIVAHSLGYDWNRALVPEWARLGLKPIGRRGFCTVSLSRRVLIDVPSYRLNELKMRFGLTDGPSHKASADVRTVVRLFREILRPRLESAGLTTFEAWQEFAQRTPILKCWHVIDPNRELSRPQLNLNAPRSFNSNPPPKETPSAKPVDTQSQAARYAKLSSIVGEVFHQVGHSVARRLAELQFRTNRAATKADETEHMASFENLWLGLAEKWSASLTAEEWEIFRRLEAENERDAFRIIRSYTHEAAQDDAADLSNVLDNLAKRLGITGNGAACILARLATLGAFGRTPRRKPAADT
jgi:DNA polymerase III epsilon subunit-like protein